jgi:DNA (cytosine-5)-methyltransferase 1
MTAFYNEIDPVCCAWLSNLMDAGLITPGKIDDRSIRDVRPDDVRGYERVHFFAGIAIWDHALTEAGWRGEVWTGSCPCQPFSVAGAGRGTDDERHLWPEFYRLIRECRPDSVFGEQVSGGAGRAWLDLVSNDLESSGYAVAAADLSSAGVGAPNIRQRLYWVAYADQHGRVRAGDDLPCRCGGMGNAPSPRSFSAAYGSLHRQQESSGAWDAESQRSGHASRLGNASGAGRKRCECEAANVAGWEAGRPATKPSGPFDPWRELEWIDCLDGKARPVKSPFLGVAPGDTAGVERMRAEFFPLAQRQKGDVGRLRGYGNAINAVVARTFIEAAMGCRP